LQSVSSEIGQPKGGSKLKVIVNKFHNYNQPRTTEKTVDNKNDNSNKEKNNIGNNNNNNDEMTTMMK